MLVALGFYCSMGCNTLQNISGIKLTTRYARFIYKRLFHIVCIRISTYNKTIISQYCFRPTSQQPVIYAEVNKATKLKNRQETSNQQDDDTYAGTQEGIYDQSGNRRHKENENAEQFDKIGDIK